MGTTHVVGALPDVAAARPSMACLASMAVHFDSISADLERHLATAPTDSLLDHAELNIESTSLDAAYTLSKRANQVRLQAASLAWSTKGARLHTISPGVISPAAGRRGWQSDRSVKAMIEVSTVGRVPTVADIASVAEILVVHESLFIAGSTFWWTVVLFRVVVGSEDQCVNSPVLTASLSA